MSFATEWALAIHRAVWFPVLWLTGLEAPAIETPFLDGAPPSSDCPAGSCPPRRAGDSIIKTHRSHTRPARAARNA
jgi:hypothetical protein